MSDTSNGTEQPCRALWIQVITQAKEDLEDAPHGSILHDQAVAFFVGGGHWAESRGVIADLLEMHPDDFVRCGRRWIAERRTRDGLPPEQPRVVRLPAAPPPQLVVRPSPAAESSRPSPHHRAWLTTAEVQAFKDDGDAMLIRHEEPPAARLGKAGRRRWFDVPGAINPFAPYLARNGAT